MTQARRSTALLLATLALSGCQHAPAHIHIDRSADPASAGPVLLDQKGCCYIPHVIALLKRMHP